MNADEHIAPCPFCAEDLAPLYEGFGELDVVLPCVRCMAVVVFTADLDNAEHAERLRTGLMEYLPSEETACRPEMRALPWSPPEQRAGDPPLYLLAAWNLDEWIGAGMAARVADLPVEEVEQMLSGGEIRGGRREPSRRRRSGRQAWLVSREGLLEYLDKLRAGE
jgi:hypothetical protein